MTKLFRLDQYTRHDLKVWYSTCQVPITDKQVIDRLEAEYREYQRQQKSDPRPLPILHVHAGPVVRQKGQYKTPRESRGNGRVE